MISLLLFKQIAQLFLAMLVGFCLVRCGLLKPKDSRVLSVVALYAALPCVIIESFQMDCTPEMVQGLLLALLSAVLIHLVMFLLTYLLRRPLRLHPVEQASVVYSNANNLIIPIVSAILGSQWLIYINMFVIVQLPLLWSHCRILLSGQRTVSIRKILLNVNILSIFLGGALFFLGISLPPIVAGTMTSIGNMLGTLSMLVSGMLMGGVDFRRLFTSLGIWWRIRWWCWCCSSTAALPAWSPTGRPSCW